jgi:hypothetical protein
MRIGAGSDERDRAAVLDAICIAMDAFVQLRRNAEHECPRKREAENGSDENSGARAHRFVHRDAIFCLSAELATLFCEADILSGFCSCGCAYGRSNRARLGRTNICTTGQSHTVALPNADE